MAYNDSDDSDEEESLDTSWLYKFKKDEYSYTDYYKEPVTEIKLYLLYIKDNELVAKYTRRCALDEHNKLKRDRLIYIIKHYQLYNDDNYKLNALLRYNIDLNPEEITDYVYEQSETNNQFITSEKYLEDLHYNDSINMFQDLNALYFIYIEDQAHEAKHCKSLQSKAKQHEAKQHEAKQHEAKQHEAHHTKKIKLTTRVQKTKRNKKNLKITKEIR
jgi:hypothetical protein